MQAEVNPNIEIKGRVIEYQIQIIFKDNDLGFDLEKRGSEIFGLYKHFHFHTEGRGLGLYMVKSHFEALGGKISLESEVNKGTEFKIEFV